VRSTELRFAVGEHVGEVSALLLRPADAHYLLALAHGAGAGMRQAFMEALAACLWKRGAAGRPSVERGKHLRDVPLPMLFLQGTRDRLADLRLLHPLCDTLGRRATLHAVEGADHSFRVLKRSGRSDAEVLDELADSFERWSTPLV
jgi:predicted alpha/beta-hydrolase family hydrolase